MEIPKIQSPIRVCALAFAAILSGGSAAAASSTLDGIAAGVSPWTLYQISETSGASSDPRPINGYGFETAMATAPNGLLFANGEDFFFNDELLTLNLATGATTLVAPLTGVLTGATANSFAFSPDGTLFAIYGNRTLYTINTSTGSATLVGSLAGTAPAIGQQAVAFSSSGTLYLTNAANLYTVNQSTGATSLVAPLNFNSSFGQSGAPILMNMSFDPIGGILYTSLNWSGAPNGGYSSYLGTIDIATGAVTEIGSTAQGLGPLAFETLATPEPSSGLYLSAGVLTLAWRRSLRSSARRV
jgi:hypothetical protein